MRLNDPQIEAVAAHAVNSFQKNRRPSSHRYIPARLPLHVSRRNSKRICNVLYRAYGIVAQDYIEDGAETTTYVLIDTLRFATRR